MKGSNFKLVSAIVKGYWLIDPFVAFGYLDMVDALLAGEEVMFGSEELDPLQITPQKVALVSINGPLMKEDFCGDPGMDTIGAQIKALDGNDKISGIVLKLDSPGGSVSGTEQLAKIIAKATKPVVAFVDQADSAAYWIASGANKIILSGETAEVGGIGTMASIRDFRKRFEAMGVKGHIIFASKSKDKNRDYFEALDGKYDALISNRLDPLNEVFHAAVKANRSNLPEEVLTGKVYIGSNAIDKGLADSIGTIEDAVAKVIELAPAAAEAANLAAVQGYGGTATIVNMGSAFDTEVEEMLNSEQKSNINKTEKEMFNSKLDKAVDALAAKVKAGEEILAEDMAPVDAELKAKGLDGYAIAREEVVAKLESDNATLTTANAELETKLEASEEEVKRLGALPGVQHTEPEKPEGDQAHGGNSNPEDKSEMDVELDELIDQNK